MSCEIQQNSWNVDFGATRTCASLDPLLFFSVFFPFFSPLFPSFERHSGPASVCKSWRYWKYWKMTTYSASIKPRTSPDKFAVWLGLESPDLESVQSLRYAQESICLLNMFCLLVCFLCLLFCSSVSCWCLQSQLLEKRWSSRKRFWIHICTKWVHQRHAKWLNRFYPHQNDWSRIMEKSVRRACLTFTVAVLFTDREKYDKYIGWLLVSVFFYFVFRAHPLKGAPQSRRAGEKHQKKPSLHSQKADAEN